MKKRIESTDSKRKIVYIKERAFLAMILSVIEVYKKESIGLLLGYSSPDEFIVEYAIPYQTAETTFSKAEPKLKAFERMSNLLQNLPVKVIGDYHSHTEFGKSKAKAIPSGEDIADMSPDKIHLILAVNAAEKNRKWNHHSNGSISGTFGNYEITIAAATLYKQNRYNKLKIICPSATGI
ncbi:MAG: Mov34/MPN/PAD-1 family protein [Acidobacteriota bacterium]